MPDGGMHANSTGFLLLFLLNHIMLVGKRSNLRQVGYAKYLMTLAQGLQFFSDGFGSTASNTGINFIEDQGTHRGVRPAVLRTAASSRWSSKNGRPDSSMRTLVFDEIDTGIGGRAAEAVGKKLKSLGQSHQVLCITHLPQIASFADQHYVIEKKEKKESGAVRVHTTIRRLSEAERTAEIARMLSGAKLTETSLRHAEQMLTAKGLTSACYQS